jgi:drug/metabolite transporter (DMT)-like permease
MLPLLALLAVTAVWGVTFVQVKEAIALYPLFAFLALRFAIASAALALPGYRRVGGLGRDGLLAGGFLGLLLAAGFGLQTAGLERTTVSSTGFITGLYVVLTPLLALVLFRQRAGALVWAGVALALVGLALLSGIDAGSSTGDLLVLASTAAQALQIVMVERYATRYDALALTLVEMATAFLGFLAIALALGELSLPRGWTVWGALLVTGVFASAFAYLIQVWAQRRISATRSPSSSRSRRSGPGSSATCSRTIGSGSRGGAAARSSWRGSSWPNPPLPRFCAAFAPAPSRAGICYKDA